ncbi:polysaccharide deacetylase family protein [Nocardioides marinquilinus]
MRTTSRLRVRTAALLGTVVTVALLTVGVAPAPASAPAAPARCSAGNVALTFDDGPSPTVTPRLVRLLRRHHVPATFFMTGERVRAHPEVARLVARRGFTVANHTETHAKLTELGRAEVRREVRATWRALRAAGVHHASRYVRPPYGATDARVERVLRGLGAVPVLWTVDSRDWDGLSPAGIRRTTLAQVFARGTAGSVVLHHDGVTNSEATLAALPSEIYRLRREGYCLVGLPRAGVLS